MVLTSAKILFIHLRVNQLYPFSNRRWSWILYHSCLKRWLTVKKKFEAVFVTVATTDEVSCSDLTNNVHITAFAPNIMKKHRKRMTTLACQKNTNCINLKFISGFQKCSSHKSKKCWGILHLQRENIDCIYDPIYLFLITIVVYN